MNASPRLGRIEPRPRGEFGRRRQATRFSQLQLAYSTQPDGFSLGRRRRRVEGRMADHQSGAPLAVTFDDGNLSPSTIAYSNHQAGTPPLWLSPVPSGERTSRHY